MHFRALLPALVGLHVAPLSPAGVWSLALCGVVNGRKLGMELQDNDEDDDCRMHLCPTFICHKKTTLTWCELSYYVRWISRPQQVNLKQCFCDLENPLEMDLFPCLGEWPSSSSYYYYYYDIVQLSHPRVISQVTEANFVEQMIENSKPHDMCCKGFELLCTSLSSSTANNLVVLQNHYNRS